MRKLLLTLLISAVIAGFYQASFGAEEDGNNLKIQSINAYEASLRPDYFNMNSQNQLDSMVQFRYNGIDSSYQYKIQYRDSTNGNQTVREEIQYQWQNSWQEKVKNEYTYNSEGQLTKSAMYIMDSTTAQWQETMKNTYGYQNGKHNENVVQRKDSVSNSWKNAYKFEYEYNNSDSVTQQLMYSWNDEANDWEYAYKNEYFYNYLNCRDSSCQYQWDSLANQWAKQFKNEYQYNDGNQLKKQYQYCYDSTNCQWDSCVCQLYEYENEYLYKHEYSTYDSVGNLWNYEWKHEYFYNSDGQVKQIHRYKYSSLKSTASDWELDTKDFYFYSDAVTGMILTDNTVMQEIRIYPNPASDQLTLDLGDMTNCRLQVIDMTGRVIDQYSITTNKTVIQLMQYKPGTYFFVIDNGEGRKANRVIIQ